MLLQISRTVSRLSRLAKLLQKSGKWPYATKKCGIITAKRFRFAVISLCYCRTNMEDIIWITALLFCKKIIILEMDKVFFHAII